MPYLTFFFLLIPAVSTIFHKCESTSLGISLASEFWKLGLGEPYPVSAIHGSGTGDLLDLVIEGFPEDLNVEDNEDKIMMSIIGRPNVGKSSLLNAICGEKRAIVSDISGTTTDSIDTLITVSYTHLTLPTILRV